ncbi:hypothetical protein CVS28_18840 [Arthrobacter glacialis]|nr:hypothetical protein CVS28_18840 [Arthrobacter glacialis]
MMRKNLWRGHKVAGAVAAIAVAGTMVASALPALASTAPADAGLVAAAEPSVSLNPQLPQECGLNLAMVFDMSNSMSDSDVKTVKTASTQAVAALQGTGTTMGVYSFGTFAKQELAPTSVASSQGTAAVTGSINGIIRPGSSNEMLGGTNWQQALAGVPVNAYDGVIFFTDGLPTFFGSTPLKNGDSQTSGNGGTGQSDDTNVTSSLNAAIPEANRLKDAGTRMIGVGVKGADAARLAKISGPEAGSDFFTTNYDELAKILKDIATAGCTGTLNINKAVEAFDSSVTTPGEGWTFDATPSNAAASVVTTGANGQAGMALDFQAKEPVTVTIKERQQPGYTVVQNGGYNAVCTRDGAPLAVTNTGDAGNVGFEVTAVAGTVTSCTVTNKVPVMAWTMAKTSDATGTVGPGDTINYTVEARNTGERTVDGITFRDDLAGVLVAASFVAGSAKLTVAAGAPSDVTDPLANVLTAGPFSLAKGETAILSYQTLVNDDAYGATLTNSVSGTGTVPPAECAVEKPCTTTDIVTPKPTETAKPTPTPTASAAPSATPTQSATATETATESTSPAATTEAASAPASTTAAAVVNEDLAQTGATATMPLLLGGLLMAGGVTLLLLRRVRRTH